MNGFEQRIKQGVLIEQEAIATLKSMAGVEAVALNGTEHTHPEFVDLLRQNDSEQSLFIRHAPDGLVLKSGMVVHFDIKAAVTIEKNAYKTYLKYRSVGCRVMLIIKTHSGEWYIQDIDKLRLIDGRESVKRFGSRAFPVDDDGWICPRASKRDLGASMSGTPYRYIDIDSMNPWEDRTKTTDNANRVAALAQNNGAGTSARAATPSVRRAKPCIPDLPLAKCYMKDAGEAWEEMNPVSPSTTTPRRPTP